MLKSRIHVAREVSKHMNELIESLSWNKKIHVLRVIKGWSQKEVAYECGTNQQTYQLWESGKNEPRNNSKRAIAAAFGVKVEEIFGEVQEGVS